MSEQPPEPFDTVGDEHVEARIVAWVLGESSAFEAAELERLCGERPELDIFRQRMQELHALVREAALSDADKSWELPPEKRRALDAKFNMTFAGAAEPDPERHIRRSSRRALWGIAACLVLTVAVVQLIYPVWRRHGPIPAAERHVDFLRPSGGGGSGDGDRATALDTAIRDQEDKVEERRKVLATLARTEGIVYKGEDSFHAKSEELTKSGTAGDSGKRGSDAQEYAGAKSDFESDRRLLDVMKRKRAELNANTTAESLADNGPQPGAAPASPESRYRMETRSKAGGKMDLKQMAEQSRLARLTPPKPAAADAEAKLSLPSIPESAPPLAGGGAVTAPGVGAGYGGGAFAGLAGTSSFGLRSGDESLQRNQADAISKDASEVPAQARPQSSASMPTLAAKDGFASRARIFAGEPAVVDSFGETAAAAKGGKPDRGAIDMPSLADRDSAPAAAADGFSAAAEDKLPAGAAGASENSLLEDARQAGREPSAGHGEKVDQVRRGLNLGEGNFNLGKYDDAKRSYEEVLKTDPSNAAARRGMERVDAAKSDYYRAAYDHTRAGLLSEVDAAWELAVPADKAAAAAPKQPQPVKEKTAEDPADTEIAAAGNPYSTFSLNVTDASFQLAKAALEKGEQPDPKDIKVEQFYNAVDYGDPAPAADQPVAATVEQCAHPIAPGRNLVRVALRTASAGRSAAQALRLTLLVDQSGSMVREDRRAAMDQALAQLGGLLTENDQVTIVGFSRTPRLLAESLSGAQGKKLGDIINQAASEGGTNLEEAMKLGAQLAERHQLAGAQNRIVLFTDGAANLGNADPDKLEEQVKAMRQKGIAFDIAGIGTDGLNDRLLAQLARHGNGRYYVVGAEKNDSLARQLAGAFRPAAENVKVQVIFNPQRVGSYKLIGYEKDRLKTEDFRNDAVDAAELAADEAGVALYQVQPLPEGSGEIGEVSVRFRDVASGEMVERSWTIPYEETASAFDRATPSMQLAGLAMMAGEKLRGGATAAAIDFKRFSDSIAEVRGYYKHSPRVGEMLRVIDSVGGRN